MTRAGLCAEKLRYDIKIYKMLGESKVVNSYKKSLFFDVLENFILRLEKLQKAMAFSTNQ